MAEKVTPKAKPQPKGADDLEILHPDQKVIIRGQEIVVREYGFIEGLKLRPKVQPFLDDLYGLVKQQVPSYHDVQTVLSKHVDLTVELMEQAANLESGFVSTFSQREGDLLLAAWWTANGAFFLDYVMQKVKADIMEKVLRDGLTSTKRSSSTDTSDQTSDPIPSARSSST